MKKLTLTLAILALIATAHAEDAPFTATSTSFKNGETLGQTQVYNGYGCTGQNLSPQLSWSGAPKGTKSFAITMYDPNAPTGSGWWHWTVFNIPVSSTSIAQGATPPLEATQGRTDFGTSRYGGACPFKGDEAHHYQLTVWALNETNLPLNAMSSGAMVGGTLRQFAIASSTITGLLSR